MRYEIIEQSVTAEIATTENKYKVTISVAIKDTECLIPNFSKYFEVESDNAQTGFEVDVQRQSVVNAYLSELNQ
jgi:hypothetical protein